MGVYGEVNSRLAEKLALEAAKLGRLSRSAVERIVRKSEGWEGKPSLKARVDVVYNLATHIVQKRKSRANRRPPQTTVLSRFDLWKKKRFLDAVRKADFRTSTTDIHITRVNFVDDPALVGTECREVTTARGRTMSVHDYFPHTHWHRTPKGLRVLNNKLTLFLSKYTPPASFSGGSKLPVTYYDAIWCQQGIKTKLRLVRGCMAVLCDERGPRFAFHQEGEWETGVRAAAVAGVRQMERDGVVIVRPPRKQREFSFVEEIYGNRIVIDPAQLVRFERWCASVGLSRSHGKITLGDVIRGYWVQPNDRVKFFIRRTFADSKINPDERKRPEPSMN